MKPKLEKTNKVEKENVIIITNKYDVFTTKTVTYKKVLMKYLDGTTSTEGFVTNDEVSVGDILVLPLHGQNRYIRVTKVDEDGYVEQEEITREEYSVENPYSKSK